MADGDDRWSVKGDTDRLANMDCCLSQIWPTLHDKHEEVTYTPSGT
jgi:hypothetical protein